MHAPDGFLVPPALRAPWLEPYWDGVRERELRLPRCSGCGAWQWYPLESGPCCPDAVHEWVRVAPTGTVFTFTEVRKPLLPGITEPYVTGLVVPDEAPQCRIASLLIAPEGVEIRIGTAVCFDVLPTEQGNVPFFKLEVNV